MKKFNYVALFVLLVFASHAAAQTVPAAIKGFVYDADTGLPITERVNISVLNTANSFSVKGMTHSIVPSRFTVAMKGSNGDSILVSAWNKYHSANATVSLNGVTGNIALVLNMTPTSLAITSNPIGMAYVGQFYIYDAEVDANQIIEFNLNEAPDGMTVEPYLGVIEWKPEEWQGGLNKVELTASDGSKQDVQEFLIDTGNVGVVSAAEKSNNGIIHNDLDDSIKLTLQLYSPNDNAYVILSEVKSIPDYIVNINGEVFKYLNVTSNVEDENVKEVILQFKVDKGSEAGVMHYLNGKWYNLPARKVFGDDNYNYYVAKSNSLSYFAITKENIPVSKPALGLVTGNSIRVPYFISGFVYKNKTKVTERTIVTVRNTVSGEIVETETGGESLQGYYSLRIHGNDGDVVKISAEKYGLSLMVPLKKGMDEYSFDLGAENPVRKKDVEEENQHSNYAWVTLTIIGILVLIYLIKRGVKNKKRAAR